MKSGILFDIIHIKVSPSRNFKLAVDCVWNTNKASKLLKENKQLWCRSILNWPVEVQTIGGQSKILTRFFKFNLTTTTTTTTSNRNNRPTSFSGLYELIWWRWSFSKRNVSLRFERKTPPVYIYLRKQFYSEMNLKPIMIGSLSNLNTNSIWCAPKPTHLPWLVVNHCWVATDQYMMELQ